MNIRSKHTSIPTSRTATIFRSVFTAALATAVSAVLLPSPSFAAPPSPEDDIDYAASGFKFPPGVNPSAWSTAAGASAAGGMNYASQPAISGPMMGGPMVGTPGMASPMPMSGPMMGNTPLTQKIPASFPSGPIPGMPVSTGLPGPIGPAAYQAAMQNPYGELMPINYQDSSMGYGYESYGGYGYGGPAYGCGCSDGGCDGACGGGCSGGGCSGGSCGCGGGGGGGFRGILPALADRCGSCGGGGCSVCDSRAYRSGCLGKGGMLGDWCSGKCMEGDFGLLMQTMGGNAVAICDMLKPYSESGKCAQRWYDLSVEAMMLGNHFSQGNRVLSTRGVDGDPVISLSDAEASDLEGGVRVSVAVILGVGGNLEMVYAGGHEWDNRASAFADNPAAPDLFSYISDFGTNPADDAGTPAFDAGFDDSDRSISQEAFTESAFHSGELNYRRRTVGPGCRFQGSWLAGLRYLRFDNGFGFSAIGTRNDGTGGFGPAGELRFYDSLTNTKNNIFVGQLGYDLWWNMVPGIQLGFGMKGGWGQNDWERSTLIRANSAGPGATAGFVQVSDRDRLNTVVGELEAKMVYRFSHSWSFRTAYHLIAMDDIINTVPQTDFIRPAIVTVEGGGLVTQPPARGFSSAVLQGFTVGAEYIW